MTVYQKELMHLLQEKFGQLSTNSCSKNCLKSVCLTMCCVKCLS